MFQYKNYLYLTRARWVIQITFRDMKTEKKADYNTVEELLSDNIGNNQKVDLETLTWNEIK